MAGEGEKTPPAAEDDDEEEDVDDLVNQINYNTITSLAALKEILGHDSRTSSEDVSWFQHYFLHHVTRLPSRSQYPGRRLSECPEEDESVVSTDTGEAAAAAAASKPDVDDDQDSSTDTSSSTTTTSSSTDDDEESKAETSPVSSAPPTPKRNPSLTPDTPPLSPRTLSRGTSPHLDKRFFDSSLIEMKSQASSSSTIDNDSTEEVWIRRVDPDTVRRKRVSQICFISFFSQRTLLLV